MKVVTNSDIKKLIIYAKRNLGIYKLVYRTYKQLYFTIIILLLIFALLLIVFLYNFIVCKKISSFIVILCMSVILSEFVLLSILYRKTKIPHFKIQIKRIELLKKYYSFNNWNKEEIEIVNNLLRQRIDTIKSNNIKVSAVIISLLLPLWNLYINKLGKNQFIVLVLYSMLRFSTMYDLYCPSNNIHSLS